MAYHQALLDLRKVVDATTAKYDELAKNDEVTKALKLIGKGQREKPKLGPSREFLDNVKLVEKLEKAEASGDTEEPQAHQVAAEPRQDERQDSSKAMPTIEPAHGRIEASVHHWTARSARQPVDSVSCWRIKHDRFAGRLDDLVGGRRAGLGGRRRPDEKPEDVLKAHGLKKSGSTYILASEADVQKKVNEARLRIQAI